MPPRAINKFQETLLQDILLPQADIPSFFGENPLFFQIFQLSGHGASVHGKILSQCGIRHRNLYAMAVSLAGKVVQICQ